MEEDDESLRIESVKVSYSGKKKGFSQSELDTSDGYSKASRGNYQHI